MPSLPPLIGSPAPAFELPCARLAGPGSVALRGRVALSDFLGQWLILVFYPHDFSMVCPTELLGLSRRADDFRKRGCALLGLSCDPVESHVAWLQTPQEHGGVSGLEFPLASDADGETARAYRVYLEFQRLALRGLFIIDPNGILQYQAVHNLSVGRRTDDVLRIVGAIQSGGMCGERWETPTDSIEPARLLVPGYRLGHYEIAGVVGTGTFATVFRARDTALDRDVALKVFRPGIGSGGPSGALAEARSAAALNHPNVCAVFAIDDTLGYPIIAMEYVHGHPLAEVLRGGPLEPARAAGIARQIAAGMAAAHARGVIHGDLKPANVMVGPADEVKILDFGLSRRRATVVASGDETLALGPADAVDTGGLFGTPSYFAPEQAHGRPATDASDVYALALMIHEMLTGRRAFADTDLLATLERVRNADTLALAAEVGPPFDAILREALRPDPTDRVLRMAEIARALAPTSDSR